MRLGVAVLCAVLCAVGAASLLPAEDVGTPEAVLAEGIALVQQGDFEAAVLKLDEASRRLAADPSLRTSRPPAAGLTRPLADAYLYLGISYLELNQELNARAKFREVLKVEPTRKLSDRVFSPQIIRVFEAARVEMFPNEKKKRSILPFAADRGRGSRVAAVAVAASSDDEPTTTQPATTVPTTQPGTGGGNPTTTTTTTLGSDPGGPSPRRPRPPPRRCPARPQRSRTSHDPSRPRCPVPRPPRAAPRRRRARLPRPPPRPPPRRLFPRAPTP